MKIRKLTGKGLGVIVCSLVFSIPSPGQENPKLSDAEVASVAVVANQIVGRDAIEAAVGVFQIFVFTIYRWAEPTPLYSFEQISLRKFERHPQRLQSVEKGEKLYFRHVPKHQPFDIEIDKLTRSIENAITGDSFKTEVLELTAADIRKLKKAEWLFDWKAEAKQPDRKVYKLVITGNTDIIQGMISLQDRDDHIFMPLIESNRFNRGAKKVYLGIPSNLVAFACKLSFDKGYSGYVSFESKTRLIEHYQKTLGAQVLFGNLMALDTRAAARLVEQYFPTSS